ncbi:hypothetical protein AB8810_07000 [Xanthomonas sp. NCPPB 3005]|uniref:hypothetical protein n=1 Tax=Xanthomonas sp. NCPPB 3005 TaxID=3240913 RepID=UPI0035124667
MKETETKRYVINQSGLPAGYPTHAHDPSFWESLGRAVATFGFLEEVLLRAIFTLTVTTPYEESELDAAYAAWLPKITRSLSDPLSNLIDTYGKAAREHPNARIESLDDLLVDLRAACKIRNALCHGSWHVPDSAGRSVPFYVNKQSEKFETAVDCAFLDQLQRVVAGLSCAVINTVTHMGWQFPGSGGPGRAVWKKGGGTSEAGA